MRGVRTIRPSSTSASGPISRTDVEPPAKRTGENHLSFGRNLGLHGKTILLRFLVRSKGCTSGLGHADSWARAGHPRGLFIFVLEIEVGFGQRECHKKSLAAAAIITRCFLRIRACRQTRKPRLVIPGLSQKWYGHRPPTFMINAALVVSRIKCESRVTAEGEGVEP